MTYNPEPRYPLVDGDVQAGWGLLAAEVARRRPRVLAIDGPAALPWERFVASLGNTLRASGVQHRALDVRSSMASWDEVRRRTADAELSGDPVFARSFEGSLSELYDELPSTSAPGEDLTLVYGPGSALVDHDVLWYADLPKRYAETAVSRSNVPSQRLPAWAPGKYSITAVAPNSKYQVFCSGRSTTSKPNCRQASVTTASLRSSRSGGIRFRMAGASSGR